MTQIRIRGSVFIIPDEQWQDWVRRGRIPADAWIRSPVWTRGVWRLAESLEVYHLFLPTRPRKESPRAPGLTDTIFRKRGLSLTEALILLNLLTAGVLVLVWREAYDVRLWSLARDLREWFGAGEGFPAILVPLFLHAGPSHLFFNMVALLAAGSVAEYFYGSRKMLLIYVVCGFGGAFLSIFMRPKGVLSVGASGAIFGLYGLVLLFLLRHRRKFGERQRWKAIRVYLPIMVIATVPAIFGGDFYTHLGGFLTGCALGAVVPPGPRIRFLADPEPEVEEPT
ncbi:MAG: rhomboid family intramembrane serine protease [Candidatus Eisenbacteria bacterium]|nr:rhomboid family intramembrane serine protease [Candidatus Latescibacterota bacterium]MBD3300961.1 rhomboid family intramembrane serine protease [Candidatus Eisenbacteria bacterium]